MRTSVMVSARRAPVESGRESATSTGAREHAGQHDDTGRARSSPATAPATPARLS